MYKKLKIYIIPAFFQVLLKQFLIVVYSNYHETFVEIAATFCLVLVMFYPNIYVKQNVPVVQLGLPGKQLDCRQTDGTDRPTLE